MVTTPMIYVIASLFYKAGSPTCILIMKKCQKQDEAILFIDASQH